MPGYCQVLACDKKYEHSKDISFHKFPLNRPDILQQWIAFTGRKVKPDKWPNRSSKICSRHFDPACFKTRGERRYLTNSSIPTVRSSTEDVPLTPPLIEDIEMINGIQQESPTLLGTTATSETPSSVCRLCGLNFPLSLEISFHDLELCFPQVNFSQALPLLACNDCNSRLKEFVSFAKRVMDTENQLSGRILPEFATEPEIIISERETGKAQVENPKIVKIKQEPVERERREPLITKIKEEKMDGTGTIWKNTNIIGGHLDFRRQFDISDNTNWLPPFTSTSTSLMQTFNPKERRKNDSKTCEILEIVNLSRPLIDITDPNITRILHSQDFNFTTPLSSDIFGLKPLKVEYIDETVDENFDLLQILEEEHDYAKRIETPPADLKQENDVEMVESSENTIVEIDVEQANHEKTKRSRRKMSNKQKLRIFKRCEACGRSFATYWFLQNHIKSYCRTMLRFRQKLAARYQANLPPISVEMGDNNKNFVCSECGKHLSSKSSLKNHESTHKGTRSFACQLCVKTFATHSNLIQHRLSHDSSQKHRCQECEKAFKHPAGLRQHVNAVHKKLRPHICPVCQRGFAMKYDMNKCKHSILK